MAGALIWCMAVAVIASSVRPLPLVEAGSWFSRRQHHNQQQQQHPQTLRPPAHGGWGRRRGGVGGKGHDEKRVILASTRQSSITPEFSISDDFLKAIVPGERIGRVNNNNNNNTGTSFVVQPGQDDSEFIGDDEEEIPLIDEDDTSFRDAILGYFRPPPTPSTPPTPVFTGDTTTTNQTNTTNSSPTAEPRSEASTTANEPPHADGRGDVPPPPPPRPPPPAPPALSTAAVTPDSDATNNTTVSAEEPPSPPTKSDNRNGAVVESIRPTKPNDAHPPPPPQAGSKNSSAATVPAVTRTVDKASSKTKTNNSNNKNNQSESLPSSLTRAIPAVIRELRPMFRFCESGPSTVKLEIHSGTPSEARLVSQPREWPDQRQSQRRRRRRPSSSNRRMDDTELSSSTHLVEANLAELVVDPKSLFLVVEALVKAVSSLSLAFTGTLMLLPPMIFARRVLAYLAYGMSDWYTGRYLRTTYRQLERQYWRYYQIPAALRSVARCLILWVVMTSLGRLLEIAFYDLCLVESGGCKALCGMIWIGSVVIAGEIVGHFIGKHQTPLMINISPCEKHERRVPAHHRIFRPRFILQLLRDPDSLIREIATKEDVLRPFDPKPLLFPSTWQVFRLLQMLAVAEQMPVSGESMHSMMRQILIQEVLRSEWYRVLMLEKRVALGIAVVVMYGLSTLALFVTVGEGSGQSALLIMPSLLAVLVSAWMNVFVYFERRGINLYYKEKRKRDYR